MIFAPFSFAACCERKTGKFSSEYYYRCCDVKEMRLNGRSLVRTFLMIQCLLFGLWSVYSLKIATCESCMHIAFIIGPCDGSYVCLTAFFEIIVIPLPRMSFLQCVYYGKFKKKLRENSGWFKVCLPVYLRLNTNGAIKGDLNNFSLWSTG